MARTTYTELLVELDEMQGSPREVRQRIDAAIRREFGLPAETNRLSDPVRVIVECHTGGCAKDFCGREIQDKNAFSHELVTT